MSLLDNLLTSRTSDSGCSLRFFILHPVVEGTSRYLPALSGPVHEKRSPASSRLSFETNEEERTSGVRPTSWNLESEMAPLPSSITLKMNTRQSTPEPITLSSEGCK